MACVVGLAAGVGSGVGFAPEPGSEVVVGEGGPGAEGVDLDAVRALMGGGRPSGGGGEKKGASWEEVSKDFERVVSTADGGGFYGVWKSKEKNQLIAELPRGYERQNHFFAMTVAGGETFAGLQGNDLYAQWREVNDRLVLVLPQLEVRSTGDQESKDSVRMIFTDRVLLDLPILCKGPNGQPVIDLDALLVGQAGKFFGGSSRGLNADLTVVSSVKAFPKNIEVSVTGPAGSGEMKTFHYSISLIEGTPGFKPREADTRVGYFTTSYRDFGKFEREEVNVRYINRWNLEKRDPSLRLSPPKQPIVYYVEHTVPVRYRRWVKEGVEYWNKAFEACGIAGAIEVRYQDAASGEHMDKDPEDVRYNFIRWLSNDVATAIGPSRVNPLTGEILDADVVLTDGWIRVFNYRWNELMPDLATEGMSPKTLAWLDQNPRWDPRLRLLDGMERDRVLRERALDTQRVAGGHPMKNVRTEMIGDEEFDGLMGRVSQVPGVCMAAQGKALGLATMRMYLDSFEAIQASGASGDACCPEDHAGMAHGSTGGASAAAMGLVQPELPDLTPEMIEKLREQLKERPELMALLPEKYRTALAQAQPKAEEPEGEEPKAEESGEKKEEAKAPEDEKEQMLDGVPEWFVGPALAELVAHEVGHTIGLRHNFKASSYYSFEEINSAEVKGKEPWSMSVMDYNGVNIRMPGFGTEQGDYSVIDIGPYDKWVIEYGYGSGDIKKVADRASDPKLQYATDEDTFGPDPLARRYDMASDPLTYAKNQMALATELRRTLLDEFVKDGESWARARRGYRITLGQQTAAMSMMSRWVGGAFVNRDKKGQTEGREPISVVPVEQQREALAFVMESAFRDESYGLSPELLRHLTVDKWWDVGGLSDVAADPTWELHDQILGIQASALTMLLNPQTVARVSDLEKFVEPGADRLTLSELMEGVLGEVWSEFRDGGGKVEVSSLRRNLQREHLDRLIDLALTRDGFSAGLIPAKQLATQQLVELKEGLSKWSKASDLAVRAHAGECVRRIEKALDAQYVYNTDQIGGGVMMIPLFGREEESRVGR
jgi:hypothetical protein